MSQPNEPVQNYEVVSPALESQVKTLLPSVAGYGGLLRSTNTIIPVVDVSSAAEGSTLPQNLQEALAFGSCTSFDCINGTVTLANSPGFWRVFANSTSGDTSSTLQGRFLLGDGSSTKIIWETQALNGNGSSVNLDFIVFLRAGDELTVASNNNSIAIHGNYRQIADVTGKLVDPVGFTFS